MSTQITSGFLSLHATPNQRTLGCRIWYNWVILQGWIAIRDNRKLSLKDRVDTCIPIADTAEFLEQDLNYSVGLPPDAKMSKPNHLLLGFTNHRSPWRNLDLLAPL